MVYPYRKWDLNMWWNVAIGSSVLLTSVSKFIRNSIASGKLLATDNVKDAKHVNDVERTYGGDNIRNDASFRVSKYPSKTTMGFF